MTKLLIAGVGNIFCTDDGFGSAVAQRLAGSTFPNGVELVDFGIRGVHLAYQLLDGYDALVLIDAAPHGQSPGTVSLLQVDQVRPVAGAVVDGHGMEPAAVLGLLESLGGRVGRVLIVGCEPESVAEGIGLTDAVAAAVPAAVRLVRRIVSTEFPVAEEVSP